MLLVCQKHNNDPEIEVRTFYTSVISTVFSRAHKRHNHTEQQSWRGSKLRHPLLICLSSSPMGLLGSTLEIIGANPSSLEQNYLAWDQPDPEPHTHTHLPGPTRPWGHPPSLPPFHLPPAFHSPSQAPRWLNLASTWVTYVATAAASLGQYDSLHQPSAWFFSAGIPYYTFATVLGHCKRFHQPNTTLGLCSECFPFLLDWVLLLIVFVFPDIFRALRKTFQWNMLRPVLSKLPVPIVSFCAVSES